MNRLLTLFVCLIAICAVFAAPAPPAFFKPGWDSPIDPDKDCKFVETKERLTIELPGKAHDFAGKGALMNAPRLLRDAKGDFSTEVRISGDWTLSADSAVPGGPTYAGGALLIVIGDDDKSIIRMDFGISNKYKTGLYFSYRTFREDEPGGLRMHGPMEVGTKQMYYRVECRANKLVAYYSTDGQKWVRWHENMHYEVPMAARPKVGVVAFSTSKDNCKVYFDKFDLKQLPKEK